MFLMNWRDAKEAGLTLEMAGSPNQHDKVELRLSLRPERLKNIQAALEDLLSEAFSEARLYLVTGGKPT